MTRKNSKTIEAKPDEAEIPKEVLDALIANYSKPSDLVGPEGLLKKLTAALVSRAMEAELTEHIGYARGEAPPEGQGNRRNGTSEKRLRTKNGEVAVKVPRDRDGSYEPLLVPKHQRHFDGFDDQILALYARGSSVRDIRAHLEDLYGVEVSPDLITRVTDGVVDELKAWQQRPLEPTYLIVYLDALVVKIRDKGSVQNKHVYLAVGVGADGTKDVLGMWIQTTEGAKFWLSILSELKSRGLNDILVLCADGLTGMPEAVEAAYPMAIFQTCLVHVVRNSTRFVPWKERKALCADLRTVYTASDEEGALSALEVFEEKWGQRFPMIAEMWRRRWLEISPFLAFPQEVRRAIYTTNSIESLNRMLRKVLKTKGHLPTDEAATKLLYLAIRNARKTWGAKPHYSWNQALLQFAIHFPGRIPQA